VSRAAASWKLAAPLALMLIASCAPKPTVTPMPHYTLGPPYRANGVWWYPAESDDLDESGLADILAAAGGSRLTADGELFDPSALAAGHPTLQLPAIAQVTNLENGRQITVRINDRGTGDPRRLLQITPRAAALLGVAADGVARVRLRVLPVESHAAADILPGAPSVTVTAAPRGAVEVAELAPPPGIRRGRGHPLPVAAVAASAGITPVPPAMRLPGTVAQTVPRPGRLMVQLDTFGEYRYAAVQRAKMSALGARIVSTYDGRTRAFRVEVGPFPDVASADAALLQALQAGIPDARTVVD
jgi:rare lipoprotein A